MQSVNGAVVILPRNSTTEEVRQIKGQTIGSTDSKLRRVTYKKIPRCESTFT